MSTSFLITLPQEDDTKTSFKISKAEEWGSIAILMWEDLENRIAQEHSMSMRSNSFQSSEMAGGAETERGDMDQSINIQHYQSKSTTKSDGEDASCEAESETGSGGIQIQSDDDFSVADYAFSPRVKSILNGIQEFSDILAESCFQRSLVWGCVHPLTPARSKEITKRILSDNWIQNSRTYSRAQYALAGMIVQNKSRFFNIILGNIIAFSAMHRVLHRKQMKLKQMLHCMQVMSFDCTTELAKAEKISTGTHQALFMLSVAVVAAVSFPFDDELVEYIQEYGGIFSLNETIQRKVRACLLYLTLASRVFGYINLICVGEMPNRLKGLVKYVLKKRPAGFDNEILNQQ